MEILLCGDLKNYSSSRLDHFLVSEECENPFIGLNQSVLPRSVSNHTPMLLDGCGLRDGYNALQV